MFVCTNPAPTSDSHYLPFIVAGNLGIKQLANDLKLEITYTEVCFKGTQSWKGKNEYIIDLGSLNTKTILKNLFQPDFSFKSASKAELLMLYTAQKTSMFPDCVSPNVSMCPHRGAQKTSMCPDRGARKTSMCQCVHDLDTLTFSELHDLDTLTLLGRHNLETLTFSERCIA